MAAGVISVMSPRQRVTMTGLAVTCCCLVVVVALEAHAPADDSMAIAAPALAVSTATTAATPPTFTLPPLDNFSAVAERPLFSPDRQPSAQPGPAGTGAWSTLTLAGVIVTPDARQALIAHGQPKSIVHLREGQSVDGWTLRSIAADRVVVANGHEQHELRLFASANDDAQDPAKARGPHPRGR
jgi:hypothetical protein